jgi:hypothetical protein
MRPLQTTKCKWQDNIKIDFRVQGYAYIELLNILILGRDTF